LLRSELFVTLLLQLFLGGGLWLKII